MLRFAAVLVFCITFAGVAAAQDGPVLLEQARDAQASGDSLNAILYATQALNTGDLDQFETAEAHFYRGSGLLLAGQLEQAITDFDLSEGAYGRNLSASDGPAVAYYLLGRDAQAWENADAVLDFDSWHSEGLLWRGLSAWQLGRTADAIDDLEDAIDADDRGMTNAALGMVLRDQGDSRADEYLARAASGAFELAQYGYMAARGGDRDRAIQLLCLSHRVDPDNARVQQGLQTIGLTTAACP